MPPLVQHEAHDDHINDQNVAVNTEPSNVRQIDPITSSIAEACEYNQLPIEKPHSVSGHFRPPLKPMNKESEPKNAPKQCTSTCQAMESPSLRRSHDSPCGNPFIAEADSRLNPKSHNFSAVEWAQTTVKLLSSNSASLRAAGVCFQNLRVHGFGATTDYHKNVANMWLSMASIFHRLSGNHRPRVDILHQLDGLVRKGEMLVVLGPPGSGCSTLLKSIAGETNGIHVKDDSYFNYQGISAQEMHSFHRGESIYTAELDEHFPLLTVGDTLSFAARARQPCQLPPGVDKIGFSNHLRDVIMTVFGISHTVDSMVGNEFVRGISGGERKRVTICEAALSGASLQCWDNSTRGLDSANALEFCKALRLQTEVFQSSVCVSIYQSPQSAYDLFDKVTVLYEGHQIFFGRTDKAQQYFVDLGFECPPRQTTPDFLTSMTAPSERVIRPGFESRVPRSAEDFKVAWRNSDQYKELQEDIEQYKVDHPIGGSDAEVFRASKQAQQAKWQRKRSPYITSFSQQVQLCLWRGWKRLKADPGATIGVLVAHSIIGVIVGSLFSNMDNTSSSFFHRGSLLFWACLLNAFSSALEILTLFEQRTIVEKHRRYAFYHPSAEAVSALLCSIPQKIVDSILFNVIVYFMTNLRREPGAIFYFWLISFSTNLVMSMIFRIIGSASRSLFEALVPAGLLMLDLIIFTGFVLPQQYMLGWSRWLHYLDPLAYAFESLMVNEFHNRKFTCDSYVPSSNLTQYANVSGENRACRAIGSIAGREFILGDDYLKSNYDYSWNHRWRNFVIILAFTVVLMALYMLTAELAPEKKSRGEVLIYRRGHKPTAVKFAEKNQQDPEASSSNISTLNTPQWETGSEKEPVGIIQQQTSVFHWRDVCYDIKFKKGSRRILDHVDGWVKPGTLTALMGVSGAGKTSLLDCLADRVSIGVITGEMFVNGKPRDASFQRRTGYVQQQDLHLQTSTIREALNFSAILRQPAHVSKEDKLAYVEEVIKLLGMDEYAEAIIGVPGEGLNVEQRKRLTIAVELVAKPPLLLFVDEPTSGLDSQTSWAILDLLEKLTNAGQAILCTIHQPSAMLFQRFHRLLLLAENGKTAYFGEIGDNYQTMVRYFERQGGQLCPSDANPAEWMLKVIGAAPGTTSDIDWFDAWRKSPEYGTVQTELESLENTEMRFANPVSAGDESYNEFSATFTVQLRENLRRVFEQYWRTPAYIYAKAALCTLIPLFIGFVFFRVPQSIQGLQSQMFSIFCLLNIFGQIVQQSIPQFVIQRYLYEARERPAKVYSWKVFILSQIVVEFPWNCLMAVFMYFSWYYPIGLFQNAELQSQVTERGALVFLFLLMFMIFAGTFSTFMVAGFESVSAGGTLADLFFSLCLMFCGVLVPVGSLPRFWIFMYRVSPFTYLVSGVLSSALANTNVICADNELLSFMPTNGESCGDYLAAHIQSNGGYLLDSDSSMNCLFCPVSETNKYLETVNVFYTDRWRNFGILWSYILFNIFAALTIYWLARVPRRRQVHKKKTG